MRTRQGQGELGCAKSPVRVWRRMKVKKKIVTTVSAKNIEWNVKLTFHSTFSIVRTVRSTGTFDA